MKSFSDKGNKIRGDLPNHIWHFKGSDQSGPNVLVLGGTHGDELVGLEVVRRILKGLNVLGQPAGTFERDDVVGNLFVGFGNPEAIIRCSRSTSENEDLNRSFVPRDLKKPSRFNDSHELKRARELCSLLMKTDFLFDIHSTSSPSKPFVCFGKDSPKHRKMYKYFPVDTILTDPNNILVKDLQQDVLGTTDFFVNNHGGTAFCYETGWEKDLSGVDSIIKTVVEILFVVGVANNHFARLFEVATEKISKNSESQRVYELVDCIVARFDGFNYAQGMARGWQKVRHGQKVGCYPNGKCEYIRTEGMYLFPKASQKVRKGKNLFYVANEL